MNDEQINKDRQARVTSAKGEIEEILRKYELDITAEDKIGENTMLKIKVQFVDTKRHDSPLAQEHKPIVNEQQIKDLLEGEGDPIPFKKK